MKSIKFFLLILFFGFSVTAYADANKVNIDLLLEDYAETWSTKNSIKRLDKIERIWVEQGVHQNQYIKSEGFEAINNEISGFQQSYPDASIRFENIKRVGNSAVCTFIVTRPDGEVLFTGIDYFEFTDVGKLVKVLGFI